MSSSKIVELDLISKKINIYVCSAILIVGVIGGCFNVLIFLSFRTFRENSCAFYLLVMSVCNLGQLATGLLRQIMVGGFSIDWTQSSLFYCKWRTFCFQACMLISLTNICLATIDQYWATCHRQKWQKWCNVKLAHRLAAISVIVWHLHGSSYLVFMNQVVLPTGVVSCINTNLIFQQYINYFLSPVIGRVIPLTITVVFAVLAYRNVKRISYRTVPLVRRELDKQLTTMVLVQAIFTTFAITPSVIVNAIISYTNLTKDPLISAIMQLTNLIMTCLYYLYFASPFYIYLCVSERFRRQFFYVISSQWHQKKMYVNQIAPQSELEKTIRHNAS
ncbi:unnamed protein product [Adineta ricciae]|uniref:G-protein coupled receptors family 1 profile domain-containing protein n=1 Tax=Adineta ricciae TaxID=249248 RepID=A0A814PB46_ADIRI|nr:unnamed protein product [Adineta ricciae]CAF1423548.1 unnamed protein product [Adineta ricciae]